ncbi:MAG: 3-dehydroquinate synthase [Bacteroidota bacterium]
MKAIKQSFQVEFNYSVSFTENLFYCKNTLLVDIIKANSLHSNVKVAFVIDKNVDLLHKDLSEKINSYFTIHDLECLPETMIVTGGEACKNDPQILQTVLEFVNEKRIDKHSYLIGIGGGALLDLVGYAASISHRGVKHIRIPTTVLSQNDSGVGVKNGVNYFGKKNFLGCFSPPVAVINDSNFLTTLSDRDWVSGTSEAVKVALLKSKEFYLWMDKNAESIQSRNKKAMAYSIYECAKYHVEHIRNSGDAFEKTSSRPLDFGHWAAHKLEQISNFDIKHGEAVGIGIALDCIYSSKVGLLKEEKAWHVVNCIKKLGLPVTHELLTNDDGSAIRPELLKGLEEFREHLGGILTITLLEDFGKSIDVHTMDVDKLNAAVLALYNPVLA